MGSYLKPHWLEAASTPQVTNVERLVGLWRFGVEVEGESVGLALWVEGTIDGVNWQRLMQLSGPGIYYSAPDSPYPINGLRLNLFGISSGSVTVSLIAEPVLGR